MTSIENDVCSDVLSKLPLNDAIGSDENDADETGAIPISNRIRHTATWRRMTRAGRPILKIVAVNLRIQGHLTKQVHHLILVIIHLLLI